MSENAGMNSGVRHTRGPIPQPLIGSSISVIGDELYVFGGQMLGSPTARTVTNLHSLNLKTLTWRQLWPKVNEMSLPFASYSPSQGPLDRCYHSAAVWNDKIVFYGGKRIDPSAVQTTVPRQLKGWVVLSDLLIWNTTSSEWEYPDVKMPFAYTQEGNDGGPCGSSSLPALFHQRMAITSVVSEVNARSATNTSEMQPLTSSRLVICGGQTMTAEDDPLPSCSTMVYIIDLDQMTWVESFSENSSESSVLGKNSSLSTHGAGMSFCSTAMSASVSVVSEQDFHIVEEIGRHSSYSCSPTEERPEPVVVFSNANPYTKTSTLKVYSPFQFGSRELKHKSISLNSSPSDPTHLQYPDAFILGRYILLCGISCHRQYQQHHRPTSTSTNSHHYPHATKEFEIWAGDMGPNGTCSILDQEVKIIWNKIDIGSEATRTKWTRAIKWKGDLVMLGSKAESCQADLHDHLNSFTYIKFINLESYGIYDIPKRQMDPITQSMSLESLKDPNTSDFNIITMDGERLTCSRQVIVSRWPWLGQQLALLAMNMNGYIGLKDSPKAGEDQPIVISLNSIYLPLNVSQATALIQFSYTLSLSTPLQRSIPTLCALLIFTTVHPQIPYLRDLVVHALHETLTVETASKIHGAATLGKTHSLQARAMRLMYLSKSSTFSSSGAANSTTSGSNSIDKQQLKGRHRSSSLSSVLSASLNRTLSSSHPTPRRCQSRILSSSSSTAMGRKTRERESTAVERVAVSKPLPHEPKRVQRIASYDSSYSSDKAANWNSPSSSSNRLSQLSEANSTHPSPRSNSMNKTNPVTPGTVVGSVRTPVSIIAAWRAGEEAERAQRQQRVEREREDNLDRGVRAHSRANTITEVASSLVNGVGSHQLQDCIGGETRCSSAVSSSDGEQACGTSYSESIHGSFMTRDSSTRSIISGSGWSSDSSERRNAELEARALVTVVAKKPVKLFGKIGSLFASTMPDMHSTVHATSEQIAAKAFLTDYKPTRKTYAKPEYTGKAARKIEGSTNSSSQTVPLPEKQMEAMVNPPLYQYFVAHPSNSMLSMGSESGGDKDSLLSRVITSPLSTPSTDISLSPISTVASSPSDPYKKGNLAGNVLEVDELNDMASDLSLVDLALDRHQWHSVSYPGDQHDVDVGNVQSSAEYASSLITITARSSEDSDIAGLSYGNLKGRCREQQQQQQQ